MLTRIIKKLIQDDVLENSVCPKCNSKDITKEFSRIVNAPIRFGTSIFAHQIHIWKFGCCKCGYNWIIPR